MPTLFKKSADTTQNTQTHEVPSDGLKPLAETKEGSQMHTLTESNQETNQSVDNETPSPKNLAEDGGFMAISAAIDKQLDEEARPLIAEIEKYLSGLSGKTKMDHATYVLQELEGLRFDPSCDSPHDPAVYGIVASKIEQYADSKFAAALKVTFGLYTESDEAYVLPKIFPSTFPKILSKTVSVDKKEDEIAPEAPNAKNNGPRF
jgi:hypothetical protein